LKNVPVCTLKCTLFSLQTDFQLGRRSIQISDAINLQVALYFELFRGNINLVLNLSIEFQNNKLIFSVIELSKEIDEMIRRKNHLSFIKWAVKSMSTSQNEAWILLDPLPL
jgi:hypothetical protein